MENNLEIDVKNAKALGLSYGQHKAQQYDPKVPTRKRTKKEVRCWECGGIVKLPRIRYCCDECLRLAHRKNKTPRKDDSNG